MATPIQGESIEVIQLRCLLLSPVDPPDPRNGDVQYTEDLVRFAPPGIEYVTYQEALMSGEIEWGPSLRAASTFFRPTRLPAAVTRAILHVLRRARLLLPDSVRLIRVRGRFDVVHIHCFPVRFLGEHPPVLLSDSAGTFWYWTYGRGLSEHRVERLLRREHKLARLIGYSHPTANPSGEALTFFVETGRSLAARIGVDASAAVICPAGIPAARRSSASNGRTLLFVGRWFELKGGPEALEIFARVRERVPAARLLVAGPDRPYAQIPGVEWLGNVSRERLYDEIYPSADVFLYPTTFDTAAFVVQEALGHGVPIVAPRRLCLPDLVRDGETGFLYEPDDLAGATDAIVALLENGEKLTAAKHAARHDFEKRFTFELRNRILGDLYRTVVTQKARTRKNANGADRD